jgi:hypothetical protein
MVLKLVHKEEEQEEDRGAKAPVLLGPRAGLLLLLRRLGSKSRGYALAGAGVVAGAVVVVSLLSWLAPDSDRPIASPLEVVGRVAGGVLEQVDDQVAALLGTGGETVLRDVRENLTAVGARIPWSGKVSEITPDRSSASSGPSATATTIRPIPNTPAQEEPSSPTTNEPSPTTYAPSPSSTSETPSATEPQPPATTGEPAPPPPTTEEPPAPPVEEPLPPIEEPPPTEEHSTPPTEGPPPTEKPPVEEVPPPEGPPPTTDGPTPPATEEPPPTTDQPPRPPTGLTKDAG